MRVSGLVSVGGNTYVDDRLDARIVLEVLDEGVLVVDTASSHPKAILSFC